MELCTDRLILRDAVFGDWRAVLAYQSDPRYLRYYPWSERSAADVQHFVRRQIGHQSQRPRIKYQLAILLRHRPGMPLIGNCGIRMATAAATEADLGYEIAPEHWGHGYATEAAEAMMEFGFESLRLHRIWAECIAENVGSARVLEKLGMQQEGRLRDHRWMKGRWWDTLIYAMLEDEWRDV